MESFISGAAVPHPDPSSWLLKEEGSKQNVTLVWTKVGQCVFGISTISRVVGDLLASAVSPGKRQTTAMTSEAPLLLVLVLYTAFVSSELFENFKNKKFTDLGSESGRAQRCKGSKQNFTLEWTPKKVSLGLLHISFAITPLVDRKEGKTCIHVYFDETSYYQHCSDFSFHCGEINKYFPNTCPFRKGVSSKGSAVVDLHDLPYFPNPGNYTVELKVIGLDGTAFLCMELHVPIVAPPPEYEYD
ncbi:hypothetical protein LSAT2_015145 [Lamellibrachia satsuma]|nr:hypothetical protein LSAT2_015145 [Lamellibrachia satsuma]